MPFLHVDDRTVPLRVDRRASAVRRTPTSGVATRGRRSRSAIVELGGRHATIRRASLREDIRVNGFFVALGAEPSPLLHGDRIEVAGRELRFAEESESARTLVVPAFDGEPEPHGDAMATRVSRLSSSAAQPDRGRLVSLVDGREYPIAPRGMRLGREASSDIVVPTGEVSRRHAEVVRGRDGFEVRDTSTNGVWGQWRAHSRAADARRWRRRSRRDRGVPLSSRALDARRRLKPRRCRRPVIAVPAFESEPPAAVANGASTRLVAKYRPPHTAPAAVVDRTIAPAPRGARVTALVSALLLLILLALTAR